MRMKLFLTLFTVGVILLAGCLPQLFLSSLCSVQYIRPVEQPYSRRLSCEGVVRAQKSAEVYLDTPVIPMEVPVSVGDWVGEGDSLAVIDVSLTQTVLAHSGAVAVEKEAKSGLSQQLEDLYALAESYQIGRDQVDALAQGYTSGYQQSPSVEVGYIPSAIASPIQGIVAKVNLQENILSGKGQMAFSVVDPSGYQVVISIPQSQADDVYEGCQAVIRCNGQTKEYNGTLTKLYPTAENSGAGEATVTAEVLIEDGDSSLRDGYAAKVDLLLEEERQVVMAPFESVRQDRENIEYVYVFEGGKAIRRDIETGVETAEGVEVLAGLAPGEIVLFDPDEPAVSHNFVYLRGEANADAD
ncbi:efflux RND transporter periplasmic adaptor subunit [Merdimmobilis hominis]|uniref:efflux RND transporter periplasmic adaptor subunit n=1 Tax=Merdimmobilis hominis TaxID=2897707 RepID=UPI002804E5B2|nr:efflux RND transporter periplasmic adaptor subunit [uncultured Merdimmobilis sp.]